MTEVEWLAGEDPRQMLEFLRGKASDRKLRLFACACCRGIWHLLTDERSRQAVEIADRHFDRPDGPPPRAALDDAHAAAGELNIRVSHARRGTERHHAQATAHAAAAAAGVLQQSSIWNHATSARLAAGQALSASSTAAKFAARSTGTAGRPAGKRERSRHCSLLRDLFANPFRPTPTIDPTWRRWHDGTIVQLAQRMYDSRDFAAMPILADALEEAGCTSGDVLEHCRGAGPHVRGCWVVDLILGKE